jgi:hypothetical protein
VLDNRPARRGSIRLEQRWSDSDQSVSEDPDPAGRFWLVRERMQFDQLKRREFITLLGGAAAAWSPAARAQQPERLRRIGVLSPTAFDTIGGHDGTISGAYRPVR